MTGDLDVAQGIMNYVGQMLGSILAAFALCAIYPIEIDATKGLGTNVVAAGFTQGHAFFGEVVCTFLLVFVVLETAVNDKSDKYNTTLAIGMAVFLAHVIMIPVDGCSINPTRTFGPAFVAQILERVNLDGRGTNIWCASAPQCSPSCVLQLSVLCDPSCR